MKRVVLLVLLLLSSPYLTLSIPRHVNPSTLAGEYIPYPTLPRAYPGIRRLIGNVSKGEVGRLIAKHAPPELAYLYNTSKALIRREERLLEEVGVKLALVRELIGEGSLREAGGVLTTCSRILELASLTYRDLKAVSEDLSRKLGVPIPGSVIKLGERLRRYRGEAESLRSLLRYYGLLEGTKLLLALNYSSNGRLSLEGRLLTESGTPLANRKVAIYFNRARLHSRTDSRGYFRNDTKYLPREGALNLTFYASYVPSGEDADYYSPSGTPELTLYLDKLKVAPTGRLTLAGRIRPPRNVTLTAFNVTTLVRTSGDGRFNATVNVPNGVKRGYYPVRLLANGTKGALLARIYVGVSGLLANVTVDVPRLALAGGTVRIAGTVGSGGSPLSGANVTASLSGFKCSAITDGEGKFELSLPIGLLAMPGTYNLTLTIAPPGPYEPLTLTRRVTILNPFMPLMFLTVALPLIARRVSPKARKVSKETKREGVEAREGRPKEVEVKELKGMSRIYFEAVGLVSDFTGIPLKPSHTVREYLNKVRPRLGRASRAFEELTLMLEESVYGGVKADLKRARSLLEALRRELS